MSFVGKTPAGTFKDIIYVNNNNSGVTTTLKEVKSGNGNLTCLSVSDRSVKLLPSTDNSVALDVQNSGGSSKLLVDTDNNEVKALGTHILTQYTYFGISALESGAYAADTHYPMPFVGNAMGFATLQDDLTFGTDPEPADTFTTADGASTDASLLVPNMWFLPDNIKIDGITSIEGADSAIGDTTRLHLFSYTFTSGATACLTAGTLLAHSNDQVNAGSEQAYLNTWTVDSAAVESSKVILAFFECDSANSNYSVNITVKYHLT